MSAEIIDLGRLRLKQQLARSVAVLDALGVSIRPARWTGRSPKATPSLRRVC
jgi:hypothetical protein